MKSPSPRLGPRVRQVCAVYVQTVRAPGAGRAQSYEIAEYDMSFVQRCVASMMRIVPDFERITRLCVLGAVAPVAHALEQLAVGDAGGGEEHVVAATRGRRS